MLLQVVSQFNNENFLDPLKGRVPKYDNEMMLTEVSSNYLGKREGDMVTVSHGDAGKEFFAEKIRMIHAATAKKTEPMTEAEKYSFSSRDLRFVRPFKVLKITDPPIPMSSPRL